MATTETYLMFNGVKNALKVREMGESSAGKTKLKLEGEEGTVQFFGQAYVANAGPVKTGKSTIEAEYERLKAENEKLKAKKSTAHTFDTGKRKVTAGSADGGEGKAPKAKTEAPAEPSLKEQVAAALAGLAAIQAKLA